MANPMNAMQQLDGPRDINEALQLLIAKGQTDSMVMQSTEIVYSVLMQMQSQLSNLALSLQFNGFVIGKLVEKAQAGEIDDTFDMEAFIDTVRSEFEELLNQAEADDTDESTDSDASDTQA